jgi:hypothetical protein
MKKIILISILICMGIVSHAQDSKFQLRAELYQQKNVFVSNNPTVNGFFFPKNVGFALGVERDYKKKKRMRTYQTAMVGFYNEVYFERVVTLETNYGMSFKLYKGLNAGFEAGVGYNRAQSSNLVSVYENNKWVSKPNSTDKVNRVVPSLGINLGYDFSNHFSGKLPVAVSFLANANLLYPYLPGISPIGLNSNNKLVLKYRF